MSKSRKEVDGAGTQKEVAGPHVHDTHGWELLGRAELGVASDIITVQNIPARKFLRVEVWIKTSGTTNLYVRFNGDSGTSYRNRNSANGAADADGADTGIFLDGAVSRDKFAVADISNFDGSEKFLIGWSVNTVGAGTGNAMARVEAVGKWVTTTGQISRIDIVNTSTGDFAIGSSVVVLGHD